MVQSSVSLQMHRDSTRRWMKLGAQVRRRVSLLHHLSYAGKFQTGPLRPYALLLGGSHDDIANFGWIDTRPFDSCANNMTAQCGPCRIVESAAETTTASRIFYSSNVRLSGEAVGDLRHSYYGFHGLKLLVTQMNNCLCGLQFHYDCAADGELRDTGEACDEARC